MAATRILIIDDEPDIREMLADILGDEGFEITSSGNAAEAREARGQQQPDLILLDVWMPDTDGISLLREWRDAGALGCPVVMISGHGTVETAVEATRLGAYDFVEKPLSVAKLLLTVNNALEAGRLRQENAGLKARQTQAVEPIGRSQAVQDLRKRLERVAGVDANVLIIGETGAGKEQAARWIHANSARAAGPFVVAPTRETRGPGGTDWQRTLLDADNGLFGAARNGVLYLDDISRLSLHSQQVLLGILEAGGTERLNVRLLAGTCQPLETQIRAGGFDEALYYRLNALPVEVPPLRQRQEDIPELARFYAETLSASTPVPYRKISVAAQNRLRNHHWPGNARELFNLIQRLLVLGGDDEIGMAEVEAALAECDTSAQVPVHAVPEMYNMPLREAREAFERDYLTHQLKAADGSVGRLADVVGMERTHLYRKLKQLGIDAKRVIRDS
jgi:two-component system, NtrC family, nitrogen regulation response regulator NtrX